MGPDSRFRADRLLNGSYPETRSGERRNSVEKDRRCPLVLTNDSHYGAAQGGSRRSRFQKLAPEAVRRVEYVTARQAITEVTLELCARYGAWFRCAGDLRCGGGWRQLDTVGEFSKPMAPGPRSSIPCRRRFDG